MNDKEKLEKRDSNRYRILKLVYDESIMNSLEKVSFVEEMFIDEVGETEQISHQESVEALRYLINENLLEYVNSGCFKITHSGIKEIESSIRSFTQSNLYITADQARTLIELDPDVEQWFQSQGEQYKTLINNVLHQYMEKNKT
ncbi:MAG: BrnA antitoxin family protein [Snowella sp.]